LNKKRIVKNIKILLSNIFFHFLFYKKDGFLDLEKSATGALGLSTSFAE